MQHQSFLYDVEKNVDETKERKGKNCYALSQGKMWNVDK